MIDRKVDIVILRLEANSQKERCPKILQTVCHFMCTICGLEKGPMALIFVQFLSKEEPLNFALAIQKLYSRKAS